MYPVRDLHPRLPVPKTGALSAELTGQFAGSQPRYILAEEELSPTSTSEPPGNRTQNLLLKRELL